MNRILSTSYKKNECSTRTVLLEKRHSLQALTAMQADKKIEKNLKCLRDEKEKATLCVQYNCNIVLLQEVLE